MKKGLRKVQQALMTGVSYMLPFIVVAGLVIALTGIATSYFGSTSTVISTLNGFGWTVMGFIPPILGAYVAFAIGDKAALAPGFIGGWIAANPVLEGTSASGFLGALLAGLIAGWLVEQLKKMPFPEVIDSLKSMLIIPLGSALVIYFLMAYPIGYVVGALYTAIVDGLLALAANTGTAIVLGAILSVMCAADMGGPLGKIAITFVFAVWADPSGLGFLTNAALFPGIMVPATSVGLAALIAPKKFTESERKQAPGAIVTGLVGISEATLPFAFRDPLHTIVPNIIGAAVGGAVSMAFGISSPGVSGIIGIPPANKPLLMLLSIAIAIVISTTIQVLTRKAPVETTTEEDSVDFDITF